MRNILATTFVLSSFVCACDVSSLPAIGSQSDAAAGVRALLAALGGNAPAAQAADRSATAFREAGAGHAVDVDGACSEGGSVSFSGQLEIEGTAGVDLDGFDPLDGATDIDVHVPSVAFDYTVDLHGCTHDGVTIDGSMTWSLRSEWDDEAQVLSLDWSFSGKVEFSGRAEGSCELDFHGSASSDADDWAAIDADAYTGSVCGFDAADTLDE